MKDLWIVWAAAAVLSFSTCAKERRAEEGPERYPVVRTALVEMEGEQLQASFPGRVKAAADVNLAFRIAGPIAKIYAEEGRRVRKGQILAELDARDYVLQLEATEAEYRQVKAEADRIIALYAQNGVTANDYDKAVYGLRQMTAKYEAHRNAVEDTRLRAPFDGYVQKCFFGANETVGAGMAVVSMIGVGAPEVEVNISSADFVRRTQFESFSCTVDIYPDRIFPLEMIGVTRKANLNQLYTMRLRIKEASEPMPAPGMAVLVNAVFRTDSVAKVLVPLSAVFEVNNAPRVWIYHPDTQTVESRAVKTDAVRTDGTISLTEGLQAGETIVAAGACSLKEGQRVELLPPASPTNIGGML